jgi:tetratricopeptide (TPR) repeat protein
MPMRSLCVRPRKGWVAIPVWAAVLAGLCLVPAFAQAVTDETIRPAMQHGAEAMSSGDFGGAIAAYSEVTQKLPQFAEGYFNLGLALEQAGKLDDARAALEKSLQLKPGLRGANLFLGIVDYRQNRLKETETHLRRETAIDTRSAKAFMWLGVCRLAQDDPQGAIAPLDKAYALDSTDTDILYHRGRAYLLVANASYDSMFKLNHDSMRVHQVLAEAYAQGFRNPEAIAEFELAVKMAPRQPGLHEELADQYWIAGNTDKASAAYRVELEIDPYAVTSMYKLGSLLVLNQHASEGVQLLHEALRGDPSLNDAHYYLGTGLMGAGNDQDAVREFQMAIASGPQDDRAMISYYKLAQVYRQLHDAQAAQAAMQNFLRLRDQTKERQDQHSAQIGRDRAQLPVEDPDMSAIASGTEQK